MKRKLESDEELDKEFNSVDVDEFRDHILEQELSSKIRNDESGVGSDCARVIKIRESLPKLALPPDWIAMYHKSGGVIYLNRKTRVCTWARPYHIGQASVRKHDVPAVAIPCFHQIMALEKCKKIQSSNSHDGNTGQLAGNSHNRGHSNQFGVQSNLDCQQGNAGSYHGNNDCTGCQEDSSHSNPDEKSIDDECVSKDPVSSTICPVEDIENCDIGNSPSNRFKFEALNETPKVEKTYSGESCVNDHNTETDLENSNLQSSNCQSFNLTNPNPSSLNPEISNPSNSNPDYSNPESSNPVPESSFPENSNPESSNSESSNPESSCPKNSNPLSSNPGISNRPTPVRNETISFLKAGEICDSDSSDSGSISTSENGNHRLEMLGVEEIANYLSKRWEFHEITRDEERRLLLTDSNEPPPVAKEYKSTEILKTIPYLVQGTNPNSKNDEKVVINPAGKSSWSLLHEYCLKILNVKPEYTTRESGSAKTPFLATVVIDGLHYGSGEAASKKQAKHLAAQRTLEIFLPESFKKLMNVEEHLKIFDTIPIEDPNVYELTSKLGLLSPYQVLNECIKRNQGVLTSELKFELHHSTTNRDLQYSIECGKHKATGKCRNKKTGRELGAQALLQKLHPHLKFWGSVLRIYVDEHTSQDFTKPESPAPVTSSVVNTELLSDLKHEMWKLMKKKKTNNSTSLIAKKFTDIDI